MLLLCHSSACDSYLLSHTREPEILAQLRKETALMHGGHMQVGLDVVLLEVYQCRCM